VKRTPLAKKGKSDVAKLQKECDKYLTPIAKLLHPKCEGCGQETTVGHHWIEKSRSNRLRHDPLNIIGLCQSCHVKIHNRFGNNIVGGLDIAQKIINQRGIEWKEEMDMVGREIVKTNAVWYEKQRDNLEDVLFHHIQ